jgi:iron complex outermembrane recepter protein
MLSSVYSPRAIIIILFNIALFIYTALPAADQMQGNSTIGGRVYGASMRTPLQNANVRIKNHPRGSVTDFQGYFEISNLSEGVYTLVVSYIGYEQVEETVMLGQAETAFVEVYLHVRSVLLVEGIVVTGSRSDSYGHTEYFLEYAEGRMAGDLGASMRSVPNISATRRGGYGLDPVLRGFRYDQLNVQIDGGARVEGACPSRMDPPMAHLSSGDIDRIEILKGPYALRFGPSFGGVINMAMTAPERFETFTIGTQLAGGYETNLDGWQSHFAVFGGSQWYDFRFSGGLSDYRDYTDGSGNAIPAGYGKSDYTVKVGLNPNRNNRLQVSFREVFARDVQFPSLPMDERTDDTSIFILDYAAHNVSSLVNSLTMKLYRSDVDHRMDNRDRPAAAMVDAVTDVATSVWGFRTEGGFLLHPAVLYAGIDYAQTDKSGTRRREFIAGPQQGSVRVDNVWQDASILNMGFFAEIRTTVRSLRLIAAGRIDRNDAESLNVDDTFATEYGSMTSRYTNLSLSTGATAAVSPRLEISIYGGRGVRSPSITERYINFFPVGVDRYDYIGNPLLEPEVNYSVDLGIRTRTAVGMVGTNVFYSHVKNFISSELTGLESRNADVLGVKRFVNISSAELTGFEIVYHTNFGPGFLMELAAGYTQGKNNDTGAWLPEIPPLEGTARFSFRIASGLPEPELTIRAVGAQRKISEAFGETESAGFVLAHLGIRYRPSSHIGIAAGIQNIFDTTYYEHLNRRNRLDGTPLHEPGRVFYLHITLQSRP